MVAEVIAAAVETLSVAADLSILPKDESWVKIENPLIVEVESGFLKPLTERATSVPPVMRV